METKKRHINVFWFRRDLRLDDNTALYEALNSDLPVMPLFIFDEEILNDLEKKDARMELIHRELKAMDSELRQNDSGIFIRYGKVEEVFRDLLKNFTINAVFANHDYEPYARKRDEAIQKLLAENGAAFKTFKDQVIFEKDEVMKDNGEPYTVFTPYKNKWRQQFQLGKIEVRPSARYFESFYTDDIPQLPSLSDIGFKPAGIEFPTRELTDSKLRNYQGLRNFPAVNGTSGLGIHLRFGTVSIRKLIKQAWELSETFVNELIWREFFMMILWHFPQVVDRSFKTKYDQIEWRNDEKEFDAWSKGKTGYPLVDAGMRELNQTGHMHNRVRMVTASFLTKHLLIDWRWGEAYFAEKLLDYELSSNNGNWQWAAGSGCDAAPYFRIFNPQSQLEKFDPEMKYTKKWVPELGTAKYPGPMVDHKSARARALETYQKAVKN